MKKIVAACLCVAQLSLASASTYEELLAKAIAADRGLERLSIAEQRAEIAYERSRIAKKAPTVNAATGSVSASLGPDASLSASPSASLTLSGGQTLGVQAPLARSAADFYAKPGFGLGLPIIRGTDDKLVAEETARLALIKARASRSQAEITLEKKLAAAFKKALSQDIELRTARVAEAKAAREFALAVAVDGAEPGGTAYMSLQRSLRSASRSCRDYETKKARALADIRLLLGPGTESELLPLSYPEVDLGRALPGEELCLAAASVRAENGLARLEAAEAERRSSLTANLGAGIGLGSGSVGSENDLGSSGLELSGGLDAVLGASGLKLSSGLSWYPGSNPSVSLSLSWSPKPGRDEELRSEDLSLAEEGRKLALAEALEEARQSGASLEASRSDIAQAGRDAEEDLAFAEAQLAVYAASRDRGLSSESEYGEVLADRDLCAARLRAAELDRITWDIDARALLAGAEAFGESE
jgi:hypothetical protein